MVLKKGSFRMMHRNQWRWCRANKIRGNTLLVLLAIETGPWGAGHYTGLFHLAIYDISDYTGLTEKEVDRAMDQLERLGVIIYDRRMQVIFVRGMLARQSPSFASSENNLRGVANHTERMPEGSRAVREFINAQRNIPELFELLEGYLEGESEGSPKGTSNRPEDLKTLIPEDLRPEDEETVIAVENPATTTHVQPISLTPESTSTPDGKRKLKYPPVGSPSSSTPQADRRKPKASGKGNGKFTAAVKRKGIRIAKRKIASGEWDLHQVSDILRNDYGFSIEDMNSPMLLNNLGLSSAGKEAAN